MNTAAPRWMAIVWPAFLVAGVLEVIVFALVDPGEMHWRGQPLTWSREAVYSVSFFVFWVVACVCSGLTSMLLRQPEELNA